MYLSIYSPFPISNLSHTHTHTQPNLVFLHSHSQSAPSEKQMGNYRFRFSDMIPNAWFHKLRDMSKPRSNYPKTLNHSKKNKHSSPPSPSSEFTKPQPHLSDQRKSYHITRDLTFRPDAAHSDRKNFVAEPPRKSSRRRRRRSNIRNPSRPVSACSCRATVDDSPPSPEESTNSCRDQSSSSEPDSVLTELGSDRELGRGYSPDSWSSPCKCRARNDIVIDISNDDHLHLPPIITKKKEPTKIHHRTSAEDSLTAASPVRKSSAKSPSPGFKLRVTSPKIVHRRIQGRRSVSSNSSSSWRRSVPDSFAVVKVSKDPGRDFKESMVEMIVENNIRASADLEELLACYLLLNSDEYHDLIISVFKQIWLDYIPLRLK